MECMRNMQNMQTIINWKYLTVGFVTCNFMNRCCWTYRLSFNYLDWVTQNGSLWVTMLHMNSLQLHLNESFFQSQSVIWIKHASIRKLKPRFRKASDIKLTPAEKRKTGHCACLMIPSRKKLNGWDLNKHFPTLNLEQ